MQHPSTPFFNIEFTYDINKDVRMMMERITTQFNMVDIVAKRQDEYSFSPKAELIEWIVEEIIKICRIRGMSVYDPEYNDIYGIVADTYMLYWNDLIENMKYNRNIPSSEILFAISTMTEDEIKNFITDEVKKALSYIYTIPLTTDIFNINDAVRDVALAFCEIFGFSLYMIFIERGYKP